MPQEVASSAIFCYDKNMNKIMLKVKSFQEKLNCGYCGPVTLKVLLNYYGIKKT